jgi:hypothetical protein
MIGTCGRAIGLPSLAWVQAVAFSPRMVIDRRE